MSSCEPAETGTFHVRSDPMVAITVHDATRGLRGRGEGELVCTLPPGLYRVQLERAGAVRTEVVDHETTTRLDCAAPPLQSPVPFEGAETSHRYYIQAARSLSVKDTAPPLGDGPHTSRLFVFLRRAARNTQPPRLPSEPLAIHDVTGRRLATISRDTAEIDHRTGYLAYSSSATPGTYRLRATRSQRDVAITVPAGRAAQVFIADTGVVRLDELRIALASTAAFDPANRIWSMMECVLAAMRTPDRALPVAVHAMLPAAAEDDLCFGIAAAHVLWRSADREKLTEVMQRLARHREITDIAILERLLDGDRETIVELPPLLHASLLVALTRPEMESTRIPLRCAFAQAARTQLHDSIWCIWSARTWDERWIEPTVEQLYARGQPPAAIARRLVLPTPTVEHALQVIDASMPGAKDRPLDTKPVVDGYALGKILGRGSRSTVYLATRLGDHRKVALKLVPVSGGIDPCRRAIRMLHQTTAVEHPQILASTARGTLSDDSGIWLEMELCRGSLLDVLSETNAPLPAPQAHRLVINALDVLAAFHDRGIAHGDIAPANILVLDDDAIVIPDRTLTARWISEAAHGDDVTGSTPTAYDREVAGDDAFSADVEAMAAVYYLLLTLEPPFEEYAAGDGFVAMRTRADSIATRRPDLPSRLVRCIDRALSPLHDARPRDAVAFQRQLRAIQIGDQDAAAGSRRWPIVGALAALASVRAAHAAIAVVGITAVLVGVLIWRALAPAPSPSCEWLSRNEDQPTRAEVCLARYRELGDERDLVSAARAYLLAGDREAAAASAERLLRGAHHGDAQQILGYVALARGRLDDAKLHAREAQADHTRAGDAHGQVGDLALLSWTESEARELRTALVLADEALKLAQTSGNAHDEVNANLALYDALRAHGDLGTAEAALAAAIGRATEPCDAARTRLALGTWQREAGREALAMAELRNVRRANLRCGSRDVELKATIALAWLLRRRDPAAALESLNDLDRQLQRMAGKPEPQLETLRVESLLVRGYLAADRGAIDAAEHYVAEAGAGAHELEWQWQTERARGELAERSDLPTNRALAEEHYRRAIELVTALRKTERGHMGYFASRHRGPFDDLFALLARAGRWRDALAVVLALDANDMLQVSEDELANVAYTAPSIIAMPARLREPLAVDQILAAWRTRDLVIVLAQSRYEIRPGSERVYRLRIARGEISGGDVGDADTVRRWAAALYDDPLDRNTARALAETIVPRDGSGTLDLLAVGSLGNIPPAALRDPDGTLVVARRPVLRVLSLSANGPESTASGPPVVIADPVGDLRGAAEEGKVVASALGAGVQVLGSSTALPATRRRLWEARDATLLHIAAHGAPGWANTLALADGAVDAEWLLARRVAPRIAVLAMGRSASASGDDGRGSIAAALLEAGTAVVIATDRSIADDASLALMRDFYAQPDWRSDPPRALARVQQALDARAASGADPSQARSWAAFSVLGRPPSVGPN